MASWEARGGPRETLVGEGRTLVVGDSLEADIAAAAAAGLDAALVLSGGPVADSTDADPSEDRPRPVAVAESLAALVLRDDHNPVDS